MAIIAIMAPHIVAPAQFIAVSLSTAGNSPLIFNQNGKRNQVSYFIYHCITKEHSMFVEAIDKFDIDCFLFYFFPFMGVD